MCKYVCILNGSIDISTALLYIYGFCSFMAPFSLYPYIARHWFLPTAKVGKCLIFIFKCVISPHYGAQILIKYNFFSRPQISVHLKDANLDLYHPLFHPLKENKCLVWGEYGMMNEAAFGLKVEFLKLT